MRARGGEGSAKPRAAGGGAVARGDSEKLVIWAVFGAFSAGVAVVRIGRGRYTRRDWVDCERLNGGN